MDGTPVYVVEMSICMCGFIYGCMCVYVYVLYVSRTYDDRLHQPDSFQPLPK